MPPSVVEASTPQSFTGQAGTASIGGDPLTERFEALLAGSGCPERPVSFRTGYQDVSTQLSPVAAVRFDGAEHLGRHRQGPWIVYL
jgi:hypothetical protein